MSSRNGSITLDPALIKVIQKHGYCILVADYEDAALILNHDVPALNIPDVDLLTSELLKPLTSLAVLHRYGAKGETFAERVRLKLEDTGWQGSVKVCPLPEDCPDISTLADRCREEPYRFAGFLLDLFSRYGAQQIGAGKADDDKIPLPQGTVEPFPVEALPAPLARFVREVSAALPCPPDFVGVPMLSVLGSAIGTTRTLEVKRGWHESPRIETAVVSEPGSKKSPALDAVRHPLDIQQQAFQQAYRQAKEIYDRVLITYEIAMADWSRALRKGEAQASDKPQAPEEPVMAQAFTTDATIEALAMLLEVTPRGLMFVQDELTGWVLSMNQYKGGKGADRQAWLSFWNGAPVVVNRKGRKEPLVLPSPFVCVAGCLPPDVLGDLADDRGREDGFIHRILFAFPDRVPVVWTNDTLSPEAMQGYVTVVQRLMSLEGASLDGKRPLPVLITFTAAGKEQFIRFSNELHAEMGKPDFPTLLRGPFSKLEGYGARLALILQLARVASDEAKTERVDDISVSAAASLVHYFKSHVKRVYAHLRATPEDKQASQALAWIEANGMATTAREVLRNHVAGVKTAEEAKNLLRTLEARGYGTVEEEGKRSVSFRLF